MKLFNSRDGILLMITALLIMVKSEPLKAEFDNPSAATPGAYGSGPVVPAATTPATPDPSPPPGPRTTPPPPVPPKAVEPAVQGTRSYLQNLQSYANDPNNPATINGLSTSGAAAVGASQKLQEQAENGEYSEDSVRNAKTLLMAAAAGFMNEANQKLGLGKSQNSDGGTSSGSAQNGNPPNSGSSQAAGGSSSAGSTGGTGSADPSQNSSGLSYNENANLNQNGIVPPSIPDQSGTNANSNGGKLIDSTSSQIMAGAVPFVNNALSDAEMRNLSPQDRLDRLPKPPEDGDTSLRNSAKGLMGAVATGGVQANNDESKSPGKTKSKTPSKDPKSDSGSNSTTTANSPNQSAIAGDNQSTIKNNWSWLGRGEALEGDNQSG